MACIDATGLGLGQRDAILASQDEVRLNVPDWLYERWVTDYGAATTAAMAAAHLLEPSLDLSVMDFSEVYADFLEAAKLPNEIEALDDIKTKIEAYFDAHG